MVRGNFGNAYSPPPAPWTTFGDDFCARSLGATLGARRVCDPRSSSWLFQRSKNYSAPGKRCLASRRAVLGCAYRKGSTILLQRVPARFLPISMALSGMPVGWSKPISMVCYLPADSSGGTPLFCPNDLVSRGLAAYMIVRARKPDNAIVSLITKIPHPKTYIGVRYFKDSRENPNHKTGGLTSLSKNYIFFIAKAKASP